MQQRLPANYPNTVLTLSLGFSPPSFSLTNPGGQQTACFLPSRQTLGTSAFPHLNALCL